MIDVRSVYEHRRKVIDEASHDEAEEKRPLGKIRTVPHNLDVGYILIDSKLGCGKDVALTSTFVARAGRSFRTN